MTLLSMNAARRIAEDLNKDKNVKKHVEKLRKKTVSAEVLREIELEAALARHSWHPELCAIVQSLLVKFYRALKVDDEARKAINDQLKKQMEPKMQPQKEGGLQERENEGKKAEPKLVVGLATPAGTESKKKAPALRVITNVARNNQLRNNDVNPAEEPAVKPSKKLDVSTTEKVHRKMNITPMKSKRTEKAAENRQKPVKEESRLKRMLSKFERMSQNRKKQIHQKENKNNEKVEEPKKTVEVQKAVVEELVKKIEDLPKKMNTSDIDNFMKGVTVDELREAEKTIGRNLKRLNKVWWFLLERDFRIARDGSSSDPRLKYSEEVEKSLQQNGDRLFFIAREHFVTFKGDAVAI